MKKAKAKSKTQSTTATTKKSTARKEVIEIKLPKPTKLKKSLRTKEIAHVETLIKVTDRELRSSLAHFKKDGWDLDLRFIIDDIIGQVFPLNTLEYYVMAYFMSKGYVIKSKDGKLVVGKK